MVAADGLQVGDVVELVTVPAHVRERVGARGQVVVAGLPWGACSVSFDPDPWSAVRKPVRLYAIRAQHLRRVEAP